jgi:DNA-binding NarL/FixJ family response regulator
MIKVMIVDDQALIREGISMLLSLSKDIEIVAQANNGVEAIDLLKEKEVDVILMDIKMPVMNGVEATKIINEKFANTKIIILTTFKDDEFLYDAIKNGASGYMLKDIKSDEIIDAIKTVYSGNFLLQSELANKILEIIQNKQNTSKDNLSSIDIRGPYEALTQREIELSILVSQGKSNKEISEMLFITEGTVKNHLTRILAKLQLRDRTQLALFIKNKMEKSE